MKFDEFFIEQVKNSVNIVDVVIKWSLKAAKSLLFIYIGIKVGNIPGKTWLAPVYSVIAIRQAEHRNRPE